VLVRSDFRHHYLRPTDDDVNDALPRATVVPDTNVLLIIGTIRPATNQHGGLTNRHDEAASASCTRAPVTNDARLYEPLRCMNPTCTNLCQHPIDGRPAVFCGATCRSTYYRRRVDLLDALGEIDRSIATTPRKLRPELRRWRKALRFHFLRHPRVAIEG